MDRFGELPRSVQNLLAIANLKALAHRAYVTEVAQKGDVIRFTMFERAKVDPKKIELLLKKCNGRMKFIVDTPPYFQYAKPRKGPKDNADVLHVVRELLEELRLLKTGEQQRSMH